jgi:capsid protein
MTEEEREFASVVEAIKTELKALRDQNRELVTEIRIRDGIITQLQERLAAHENLE